MENKDLFKFIGLFFLWIFIYFVFGKSWIFSLSIIAAIIWGRKIRYFMGSFRSDINLKKPRDINRFNNQVFLTSEKNCQDCKKEFSLIHGKYRINSKILCFECLKKMNQPSLGISIYDDDLTTKSAKYSFSEYKEFRRDLLNKKQSNPVFSEYKWFIENYVRDNKISKKDLNMFLDYSLDISPEYIIVSNQKIFVDKFFKIISLNKCLRFKEEILSKEIRDKNKWKLLVNFVMHNRKEAINLESSSEIKKLLTVLSSYGITADEYDLILILTAIDDEMEYESFKKKIEQKKPTKSIDFINTFLEIYGESYQSHLEFLMQILHEKNLLDNITFIKPLLEERKKTIEIQLFEQKINNDKPIKVKLDFSTMSGYEFEFFLKELFDKMGYTVKNTKLSNDQGADLILEKFGEKIAVQAKNYSQSVSNGAVQEVVAAKNHYECQKAMVVTTNNYTKSAIILAKSNNVELWDKRRLLREIDKYF